MAHLHVAALARADGLELVAVSFPHEQAVVLLVLCAPDLQHRHRLVAELDGADVDLGAEGVDDLLHHVAVAAGALVVQLQGSRKRVSR